MAPGDGEIGYRRNGKKQACEPCRKGKLACDHGAPFCGRCVRRKTTAKCVYHPAPMTRPRPSKSPGVNYSISAPSTSSTDQLLSPELSEASGFQPMVGHFTDAGPSQNRLPPIEVIARPFEKSLPNALKNSHGPPDHLRDTVPKRVDYSRDNWKTAVYPQSTRYHGPTSFVSILSEDKVTNSKALLHMEEDTRKHPGNWVFGSPLHGRYRPNAPDIRRKEVVKALWNLPSREICEKLETARVVPDMILSHVLIRHCITTLFSTFEAELMLPLAGDNLAAIADVLFKNEENPLVTSPVDGYEWLNTFMGPNMRIEMLGLFFCFLGRSYLLLQDWDPVFQVEDNCGRNRKETAWRMVECADVCRKMCHMSETVNEIIVALSLNIQLLESQVIGDDSYMSRCRQGDTVTMAITAGLHRLPDHKDGSFTTAEEFKRRLFAKIYYLDKTCASLNGTPPMLNRHYCEVKPCLDLSEEQLFLPRYEAYAAVNRLSANGWNTDGKMYGITVSRAIWQLSAVREEILEFALGVNVSISADLIAEIHHRCKEVMDNLPKQLLYYSHDKVPKEFRTGFELFAQACIILDFLQNRFLLERVAMARGFPDEHCLLSTAMEILEITLMFWLMRDQMSSYAAYFDWMITFYGIPCAGVICIELLKRSNISQPYVGFSRSDAIQKLTLFIGFLEWIRPTDGNYKLVRRLKKVIRNVLDHVLEPVQSEDTPPANIQVYDPTLLEIDSLNDMDWLNTIDWTHGSWIGI